MFGKGARVYLAPLFFHASGTSSVLTHRVRRSLQWWLRFLPEVPVRVVPCVPMLRERMTIYIDAAGDGCLAWVLHIGTVKLFAAIKVPTWLQKWVVKRQVQIATWELVAALCAIWHVVDEIGWQGPQLDIRIFIDSAVALGTLLRGSSRQSD